MDVNETTHKKPISRRRLIGYAWIGAGVIVLGELIAGTFAFLWPRKEREGGKKIFIAGKVNDLKVGTVVYFPKERTYLERTEAGFIAFSSVCPHLHCVVNWNEMLKEFECPCHGGKFNQYGVVLAGPPPRPLDLYKIQIVEDKVVIDTAQAIERNKFEPSQIVKG
jgi:Rieske Fe-S protein